MGASRNSSSGLGVPSGRRRRAAPPAAALSSGVGLATSDRLLLNRASLNDDATVRQQRTQALLQAEQVTPMLNDLADEIRLGIGQVRLAR